MASELKHQATTADKRIPRLGRHRGLRWSRLGGLDLWNTTFGEQSCTMLTGMIMTMVRHTAALFVVAMFVPTTGGCLGSSRVDDFRTATFGVSADFDSVGIPVALLSVHLQEATVGDGCLSDRTEAFYGGTRLASASASGGVLCQEYPSMFTGRVAFPEVLTVDADETLVAVRFQEPTGSLELQVDRAIQRTTGSFALEGVDGSPLPRTADGTLVVQRGRYVRLKHAHEEELQDSDLAFVHAFLVGEGAGAIRTGGSNGGVDGRIVSVDLEVPPQAVTGRTVLRIIVPRSAITENCSSGMTCIIESQGLIEVIPVEVEEAETGRTR